MASQQIRQQRMRVEGPAVLALGSNLGDRASTLRAAVASLTAVDGIVVTAASTLFETVAVKPDGVDESAPPYLNAVVTVRTALEPHDLLVEVNRIEAEQGRTRGVHWGDRTLDIDIITCGVTTVDTPELVIPHPRAAERAFVLVPWVQLEPDAVIPGAGRIGALLEAALATGDQPVPFPSEPLL